MQNSRYALAFTLSALITGIPAFSQAQPLDTPTLSYADLADTLVGTPIVATIEIRKVQHLKADLAADLKPGHARFLIDAEVRGLLRGDAGLPSRIGYLVDMPVAAPNRLPKLRKQIMLIAAKPVTGKPNWVQLTGPHSQFPWSQVLEDRVRAILVASLAPSAPPYITGVSGAFHVKGNIPGESETQVFLKTASGAPVSLNILRRPGEQPSWAVALGELVDEAAQRPARDSLLWYRLACFLPPALPDTSVTELAPEEALAANADYCVVLDALGPCTRSLAQ